MPVDIVKGMASWCRVPAGSQRAKVPHEGSRQHFLKTNHFQRLSLVTSAYRSLSPASHLATATSEESWEGNISASQTLYGGRQRKVVFLKWYLHSQSPGSATKLATLETKFNLTKNITSVETKSLLKHKIILNACDNVN